MSHPVTTDPFDEHLQELIVGYVLDALSAPEQREFEQLLAEHPHLQQQVSQCQEVMATLAYPTRQTPPPHLRQRILAIAEPAPPVPSVSAPTPAALPTIQPPANRRRKNLWRRVALGLGALAFIGLAFDNFVLRQKVNNLELAFVEMQGRETHRFELKANNKTTGGGASASILLDIETGKALVGVRNLPPLQPGEIYRLWAVAGDKKILCGEFNTLPSGQLVGIFPIPVKEYTAEIKAMRISREANTSPEQPTTRVMVMSSEI